MTPHDDLDLQLRRWMAARAASAPSPSADLVDGVMARAAAVRQRPGVLVHAGIGSESVSLSSGGVRWVVLLGALLAMAVAAAALVGSRPAALGTPLLAWSERGGFALVEPGGGVRAGRSDLPKVLFGAEWERSVMPTMLFGDESCPRTIPGTTLVAINERFKGIELTDTIRDARIVATVPTGGYAGTEYFAHEGPRLVLFELDEAGETGAAVTVVDLAQPPATPSRRFAAPGVVAADVDATGGWLAMAVAEDGIRVDRVDLALGARRALYHVRGSVPAVGSPTEKLSLAPGGRYLVLRTAGGTADVLLLVDLARGFATPLDLSDGVALADIAWSPDGRWLAVPQQESLRVFSADGATAATIDVLRPRQLAWSPDSSRIAFGRGDGGLVTAAPDGSHAILRPMLLRGLVWAADGTLVAARSSDDGSDAIVERYLPDAGTPAERLASLPIPRDETSTALGVQAMCLSWGQTPGGQ